MADYPLKQEAEEVQIILDTSLTYDNSYPQSLSESQKAFVREKIGASAVGEGIKILSHFDTLDELTAAIISPNPGDAFSVGTELPYNLYIYDFMRESWRNYGPIRANDIKARFAQNIAVSVSAWSEDTSVLADYTFKARIYLAEVTGNDFPVVAFAPSDAIGGNFCPIAYCFDGYVEIWAKAIPAGAITVPAATFIIQDTGDSTSGNSTKGITNASGGVPPGGIGTNQLANRSVIAQKLAPNAVSKVFTAEIGTEWTGGAAPYTQEIIVEDLPSSERIIADINLSDDWELATAEYEDFGKITKITASSGKITAYASEPTTTSLNIKLVLLNNGEYSQAGEGDSSGGSGGGSGADGFSPIAKVVQTETGAIITITDKNGITTATISNGKDGVDGKTAYEYAKEGGFVGTEAEFAQKLARELPTKLSELENDKGYITGYTETDPTVPSWAKATSKPSYSKSEVGLGNVDNIKQYSASNPPPYPVTSVNSKAGAVSLGASDVGADSKGTAATAVSNHNASDTAHNDIRLLISGLATRLDALANSDDTTLDQMAEVVEYIKSNRDLIEQVTTGKVNVSDIVNNLTTNASNKPLSAAQGVALKTLIDGLDTALDGKLASSELTNAINTALAQAKASGEFNGVDGATGAAGKDGTSVTVKSVSESTADGGSNVVTFSDGKTLTVKNGSKGSAGTNGATGERGFSVLSITTAPSSYTTATGGFTPKYRIALSTVLTQSNATKVLVGDTLKYSYYEYPIGYVDASYVYLGTRVSIRGATGAAGATVNEVIAALPTIIITGVDANGSTHSWTVYSPSGVSNEPTN